MSSCVRNFSTLLSLDIQFKTSQKRTKKSRNVFFKKVFLVLILQSTCFVTTTAPCMWMNEIKRKQKKLKHVIFNWPPVLLFDLAHRQCNCVIEGWLHCLTSVSKGRFPANNILLARCLVIQFFLIKIWRPEHSLTPHPLHPITSHFDLENGDDFKRVEEEVFLGVYCMTKRTIHTILLYRIEKSNDGSSLGTLLDINISLQKSYLSIFNWRVLSSLFYVICLFIVAEWLKKFASVLLEYVVVMERQFRTRNNLFKGVISCFGKTR